MCGAAIDFEWSIVSASSGTWDEGLPLSTPHCENRVDTVSSEDDTDEDPTVLICSTSVIGMYSLYLCIEVVASKVSEPVCKYGVKMVSDTDHCLNSRGPVGYG